MTVKAIIRGKAWVLEVLGIPYGSPTNLDSDGEYFDRRTRLHDDKFPHPPAVYYHGIGPDKELMGTPEYIGKTEGYEDRDDGRWYRVVLDQASAYAKRIWEAAQQGLARASSGSNHLSRVDDSGHIYEWPVMELSLIDMNENEGRMPANRHAVALPALKSVYQQAGLDLPDVLNTDDANEPEADPAEGASQPDADTSDAATIETIETEKQDMTEQTFNVEAVQTAVDEAVTKALAAERDAREAEQARQQEIEDAKKEAAEQAVEAFKAEAVKAGRLPEGDEKNAPAVITGEIRKYDNLSAADNAILVGVLQAGAKANHSAPPSEAAFKAMGMKLEADAAKDDEVGVRSMNALKAAGFAGKSNELNYSTYSSYGDEFIGAAYSNVLWQAVMKEAWVVDWLPSFEMPAGHESMTIPVEGTDPTVYKVAQTTGLASATDAEPAATVTSSKAGTDSQQLTLAKAGMRTLYSGELMEDSLIPWAEYLRMKLTKTMATYLDAMVIDGDTETSGSTNINDIAGTPDSADWFMVWDGFRKLALVTNTDNARAGGTLETDDFIETLKLMGARGFNADPTNTLFIVSPAVAWKMLELDDLKTRDVFNQPTLENGLPSALWGGYQIRPSWSYGYASKLNNSGYEYLEESTGKIDIDNDSDNAYGSFLAVNRDQWMFGWRRRQTMETVRHAVSDSYQIVTHVRAGLIYRDTDACAITYGLTV